MGDPALPPVSRLDTDLGPSVRPSRSLGRWLDRTNIHRLSHEVQHLQATLSSFRAPGLASDQEQRDSGFERGHLEGDEFDGIDRAGQDSSSLQDSGIANEVCTLSGSS